MLRFGGSPVDRPPIYPMISAEDSSNGPSHEPPPRASICICQIYTPLAQGHTSNAAQTRNKSFKAFWTLDCWGRHDSMGTAAAAAAACNAELNDSEALGADLTDLPAVGSSAFHIPYKVRVRLVPRVCNRIVDRYKYRPFAVPVEKMMIVLIAQETPDS